MATFNNKLGKKLHEAAGDSRLLNIFGNDFNPIYASTFGAGANFPIEIRAADESYTYDFSAITPGHEAVTCLSYITGISSGDSFRVKHEWYDKDNTLIFTYWYDYTSPSSGWAVCMFSFTGYADWELNANGACKCVITVTGDIADTETLNFTISNVTDADTLKHTPGYIWIEGNNIHFIDYWGWEHSIPTVLRRAGSWTPGYMWLEDTVAPLKNAIFYIDTSGDKRRTREAQEDTYYWLLNVTPGYLYIMISMHGNYLTFIGNDGKRYIVSDGVKDDF